MIHQIGGRIILNGLLEKEILEDNNVNVDLMESLDEFESVALTRIDVMIDIIEQSESKLLAMYRIYALGLLDREFAKLNDYNINM